jgi:hypothetical protein
VAYRSGGRIAGKSLARAVKRHASRRLDAARHYVALFGAEENAETLAAALRVSTFVECVIGALTGGPKRG